MILCVELLEEVVEEHQETLDKTDSRDFIDTFLLEMERNNDKSFSV